MNPLFSISVNDSFDVESNASRFRREEYDYCSLYILKFSFPIIGKRQHNSISTSKLINRNKKQWHSLHIVYYIFEKQIYKIVFIEIQRKIKN